MERKQVELYDSEGWLNIPELDKLDCWLNVITGARQVGKTYGVLKMLLDSGRHFMLMRRTIKEVQLLGTNPDYNPFLPFEPERVITLKKSGEMLTIIENDVILGSVVGLPTIATMRGFNGSVFSDVVYDEFIPEKHVIQRKTEGDAVLNAYTTINGNRELRGEKPLKLWMLANSNNINSPVLNSFGLVDPILKMRDKKQEVKIKDGVLIVQPKSNKIIDKRKETALVKYLIKTKSAEKFIGMSVENDFSYNETTLVGKMPMNGLKPLCSISLLYVWQRDDGFIYCCRTPHKTERYDNSEYGKAVFVSDYWFIFEYYRAGEIRFSDLNLLEYVKNIFDIKF